MLTPIVCFCGFPVGRVAMAFDLMREKHLRLVAARLVGTTAQISPLGPLSGDGSSESKTERFPDSAASDTNIRKLVTTGDYRTDEGLVHIFERLGVTHDCCRIRLNTAMKFTEFY